MCNNYKRERERQGLTIEEAASGIGILPSLLQRWEASEDEPFASDLYRMAEFYSCSPDYLLGLVNRR